MSNNMALLVPSRGRPENIERLVNGLKETEAEVDLYVGIDSDDPRGNDYLLFSLTCSYPLILNFSTTRERFGPTLNRLSSAALTNKENEYKYLAWCGDDHLPRTKGWDKRYREELDRGAGIVYGNDLIMGEAIATQLAFSPDIVRALGYAVPGQFIHLFIDNYFMELGDKIGGKVYLDDVVFQHLHPLAGKANEDLTYKEANSEAHWSNDKQAFDNYVMNKLHIDVKKIEDYREGLL